MGGTLKNALKKPFSTLNTISTFGTNKLVSKASKNVPGFFGKVLRQPDDPLSFIKGARETDLNTLGGSGPLNPSNTSDSSQPFSISPEDIAADQSLIGQLANSQYASTQDLANQNYRDAQGFNAQDQTARASARDQLSQLLTQQAANSFKQTLPDTAETYNARGLLNNTGYDTEVARQQAQLAAGIANQVGQVGLQDINRSSDIGLGALQAKLGMVNGGLQAQQGLQQSALSRGFSLQDFARQANVAKAIGAQSAPQVPSGKSSALSGGLQGAGAGASFGPWGAAIGGVGGALLGSQANANKPGGGK